MRVYTRAGDDGCSDLIGGERLPKDDPRFRALGDLDELNALLGLCRSLLGDPQDREELARAQRALIGISAGIAGAEPESALPVSDLERAIDLGESRLPALGSLILPGGSEPGALLHLARAVARRAERAVVALAPAGAVADALPYLNRLSDYLFVLARLASFRAGEAEEPYA